MKDQWDCVLNDLGELGGKEFLVLTSQYNIEIFSCCLHLLPSYSSTFHQTNVKSSQNRSEDNLLISKIQSPHLLLEVDHHDEECERALLAKGPDSSLGEVYKGSCSGDIHTEEEEVEVKVQEDEVEDGTDNEEGRNETKHTGA